MAQLGRGYPAVAAVPSAVLDVAASVTGTVAVTQDDQTSTASGTFTPATVTGTVAVTQDDQTSTAAGSSVTGTVAVTQANQTSTASGGFDYVLFDEFSGSTVTTPVWTAYERISDQVNSEVNAVLRRNVRVTGGSLLIDSKFEDYTIGDSEQSPDLMHYTSGQIGQVTAPFRYGTVEVRAKIPGGTGLWPCIWMLGYQWQPSQPTTANTPGSNWPVDGWCEIDIAEFMSNHRTTVNTSLHWQTSGSIDEKTLPYDATTRFMVYRLDWAPASLIWSVDPEDGSGFQTLKTVSGSGNVPDVAMYLIIHTAIGGNGGGTPSSGTFPQTMEVDWARITRTNDTTEPITTAYLAATQDDQTSTASGTFTGAVSGTAAVTQDSQTSTSSGSSVTGAAAATQEDQTSTASGTHSVTGTVAATQDDQTSTASGTFTPATVTGTAAVTQDDQTSTADGSSVTGTTVAVQDDQTSTTSGTANPPGTAGNVAAVQDDQTATADGTAAGGSSATTQDDQTSTASGTHTAGDVTGTVAATQDDQTSTAVGFVTPPTVTGTVDVIQAGQVAAAVGFVGDQTVIQIIGRLTLARVDPYRSLEALT